MIPPWGLYGQHITVFTGESGAKLAASLTKQPLAANGFYQLGLDYSLLADMAQIGRNQFEQTVTENAEQPETATSAAEMTAEPSTAASGSMTDEQEEVQQVVNMLEEMRGVRLFTSLDFEPNGITVKGNMELPQKK